MTNKALIANIWAMGIEEIDEDIESIVSEYEAGLKIGKFAKREPVLKPPLGTETTTVEGNEFITAFTSIAFKKRVEAGADRVRAMKAESGIVIISNGSEIVYPPLSLGTSQANSQAEQSYREHAGAYVRLGTDVSEKWLDKHAADIKDYKIIAQLHFHPRPHPFSNGDIEVYDNLFAASDYRLFSIRQDLFYGVFIPQFHDKRYTKLASLKLFMFAGPYTNPYYQQENFKDISFQKQQQVLKESGMKVVLVDLPIQGKKVDLRPLGLQFNQ